MEPLILSILGLAGSVKTIMNIMMGLGLLLILNLLVMAGMILSRRRQAAPPAEAQPKAGPGPKRGRTRRAMRVMAGLGALSALLLVTAALADLFFFEALTRQALGRLSAQAAIEVDFSSARGSFWTGKFYFDQLRARRPEHPSSVFDLRAASAEVDISIRDLMRRRLVFEKLELQGLDGSWEQRARVEKEPWLTARRPGGQGGAAKRRPFRIDHFELNEGRLDYSHLALARPFSSELRLDYLRAAPLHGDRLLFNLLFTGGARGSFSGLDFTIDPPSSAEGRQSTWRCDNLPLPLLAPLVGGPLEWFERGQADILVENRETPGAPGGTLTNWNLALRDFQVAAPEGTPKLAQMAAAPVTAYLNSKSEGLELSLDFELRPEEMRFANAAELATMIGRALGRTMTQKFEGLKSRLAREAADLGKRQLLNRMQGGSDSETAPADQPASGKEGGRLKSIFQRKPKEAPAGQPD